MSYFLNWMEQRDIFGFEEDKPNPISQQQEELPLKAIANELIIEELVRLPPLPGRPPRQTWNEVVEWGEGIGSIKIDVSPHGSDKIIASRHIKDLQGENIWVVKKIYPMIDRQKDNEKSVAHEIHEDLAKINQQMIESPKEEYPEFEKLIFSLSNECRRNHPEWMFFGGIKQFTESRFQIFFEIRGHGVEKPTAERVEQFNIEMHFDKTRGLTRSFAYEINSPTGQHLWTPKPSEWDKWFAPTQNLKEVTELIHQLFMTY